MSHKFAVRTTVWIALATLLSLASTAQESTPAAPDSSTTAQPLSPANDKPSAPPQQSSDKSSDKRNDEGKPTNQETEPATSNDRLFFALPNFLSLENGGKLPPLTTRQKFAVVTRGTFDYVQYPWWAFLAGLSQAQNNEPGYGQGAAGYGKRFATAAADGVIENFMTSAIFPSLLHQDPRFFQSTKGGFARRAGYAVSRIVITRTDSGHSQFNFSEILGSATSASISTFSYHPRSTYISTPTNPHMFVPSDRTLENATKVWGNQLAYDTLTIALKEFWPDIHRKVARNHKDETAGAASSSPSH